MTQYCAMRLRENSLGNDSGWLPGGGTASSSTSCCVRLRGCQCDVNVHFTCAAEDKALVSLLVSCIERMRYEDTKTA